MPALRRRARAAHRAAGGADRASRPPARRCSTLLASPALRSRAFVTRRYDQLVQSRTVRRPGLDAAVLRLRPAWRGPRADARRSGPRRVARPAASAGSSRSSRRRATSRASAASRSASPTASTSATPRSRRSAGSSPRRSRGWRSRARRSACRSSRATSRSTTTRTAARSPRRRSSAASASSPDVRRVPGGWREGDAILLARSRSPLTLAGSEAQARWGTLGGSPSLDLASEVALVRYATRAAQHASLVHDVAEGGLAVALAEAALWSGVGADARARRGPADALRRGRRPGDRRRPAGTGRARSDRRRRRGAPDRHGRRSDASSGSRSPSSRSPTRATPDVRRVRCPLRRAATSRGSRTSGSSRSSTAARSRPASPSHEGGRVTALREMGLVPQVFDEEKLSALPGEVAIGHTRYSTTGGAYWSNAQPLVHHGAARTVALAHNGNLVEPGAAPRRAGRRRGAARVDVRHGGDRGAARPRPGAAARGRRGDDAPARGRVLDRRDRRRHARRVPRPARHPAAHARPDRRRLGGRLGDLRARPRRRRRRAGRAPGRGRLGRRATAATRRRRCRAAGERRASSSTSTSPGPTRRSAGRASTRRACAWASGSRRRRRRRPTS